jgi:hypothetical protein
MRGQTGEVEVHRNDKRGKEGKRSDMKTGEGSGGRKRERGAERGEGGDGGRVRREEERGKRERAGRSVFGCAC